MRILCCLKITLFLSVFGNVQSEMAAEVKSSANNLTQSTFTENKNILAKSLLYTSWESASSIAPMSYAELRNAVVTKLDDHCSDALLSIHAMSDEALAWAALMHKFLFDSGKCTEAKLLEMSLDDYRNTVIAMNGEETNYTIPQLQAFDNAKNLNIAYGWWLYKNASTKNKIDKLNDISGSIHSFDLKDSQGKGMDVLRIVKTEDGGYTYLGVYHSSVGSNHYKLYLAGSNNLKTWTYITELGDRAHQGEIKKWGNGYLVANEQDTIQGYNNVQIRYYSSYSDLVANIPSYKKSLTRTFSSYAEGTPDIRTIEGEDPSNSSLVIGFHYYDNGVRDQLAFGILSNFSGWKAWKDEISNYNIRQMGYNGNIGGRSGFTHSGSYTVQEAQIRSNDWSSWRLLFGDGAFYYTLAPVTPLGSASFANPGIAPIAADQFVLSSFMPTEGNISGERGELLYTVNFDNSGTTSVKPDLTKNSETIVFMRNGSLYVANAENAIITISDITGIIRLRKTIGSLLESFEVKGMTIVTITTNKCTTVYKIFIR